MKAVGTMAMAVILLLLMGADASPPATTMDIVGLLREFGFPIFVSLWFMWRVEKRFDRFTDVIQNLLTAVTIQSKTIDALDARVRSGKSTSVPTTTPATKESA